MEVHADSSFLPDSLAQTVIEAENDGTDKTVRIARIPSSCALDLVRSPLLGCCVPFDRYCARG